MSFEWFQKYHWVKNSLNSPPYEYSFSHFVNSYELNYFKLCKNLLFCFLRKNRQRLTSLLKSQFTTPFLSCYLSIIYKYDQHSLVTAVKVAKKVLLGMQDLINNLLEDCGHIQAHLANLFWNDTLL